MAWRSNNDDSGSETQDDDIKSKSHDEDSDDFSTEEADAKFFRSIPKSFEVIFE